MLPAPDAPPLPEAAGELAAATLVVAFASGTAALWAWKPSTAEVPRTVAEMTSGARLMGSEGEGLEVDPVGRNARFA